MISAVTGTTRRQFITLSLAAAANLTLAGESWAKPSFETWVRGFRPRALRRGISEKTYDSVMGAVTPDTSVYELDKKQPEFTVATWQYINRRCSQWRVMTGQKRITEYKALFDRLERDYGVDRYVLVGLWGMESSFGDVIDNPKYMKPVIPSLAALAWGEPRRRRYWERELLNALVIVERGWSTPDKMVGSWAGAMGHTQWMPEVWLNIGVDYDKDKRVNPFGPEDALAGTCRYLVERGKYRRGEAWGFEAKVPAARLRLANNRTWRTYAQWEKLGVTRADGKAFAHPSHRAKLWLPEKGGPAFLLGQNFFAVRSYNPSSSYALALVHLGDLIKGEGHFKKDFPGGERPPTIDEVKEIQTLLDKYGYKVDGVDGRSGSDTVRAIVAYQKKNDLTPDGYAGLRLLARLRQGP
ncbi:MAG: lytic murein transglycosylase [Pseudolabrys sp.]